MENYFIKVGIISTLLFFSACGGNTTLQKKQGTTTVAPATSTDTASSAVDVATEGQCSNVNGSSNCGSNFNTPSNNFTFSCTDEQVPLGSSGSKVCSSAGAACTRVIGESGLQSINCNTDPTYGNNTMNGGEWLARCCKIGNSSSSIVSYERAVPLTSSGSQVCEAQGETCTGVVGSSGYQTLYCGANPSAGDNTSNVSWSAHCVKATGPLKCTEVALAAGTTGNAVCQAVNKVCISSVESGGRQSLFCSTDPRYGLTGATWYAHCCSF